MTRRLLALVVVGLAGLVVPVALGWGNQHCFDQQVKPCGCPVTTTAPSSTASTTASAVTVTTPAAPPATTTVSQTVEQTTTVAGPSAPPAPPVTLPAVTAPAVTLPTVTTTVAGGPTVTTVRTTVKLKRAKAKPCRKDAPRVRTVTRTVVRTVYQVVHVPATQKQICRAGGGTWKRGRCGFYGKG
jgi:hypothetical protein